jgi:hypothetical protein
MGFRTQKAVPIGAHQPQPPTVCHNTPRFLIPCLGGSEGRSTSGIPGSDFRTRFLTGFGRTEADGYRYPQPIFTLPRCPKNLRLSTYGDVAIGTGFRDSFRELRDALSGQEDFVHISSVYWKQVYMASVTLWRTTLMSSHSNTSNSCSSL